MPQKIICIKNIGKTKIITSNLEKTKYQLINIHLLQKFYGRNDSMQFYTNIKLKKLHIIIIGNNAGSILCQYQISLDNI